MSQAIAATSVRAEVPGGGKSGAVSPLAMLAWTLPQVALAGLAATDAKLWAGDQQGLAEHAVTATIVVQSALVGLLMPVLAASARAVVATASIGVAMTFLAGVAQGAEWGDVARRGAWAMAIFGLGMGLWRTSPSELRPIVHVSACVFLAFWQVLAYVQHDVAVGEMSDIFISVDEFLPTASYASHKLLLIGLLCAVLGVGWWARRASGRKTPTMRQTSCPQPAVDRTTR